MADTITEPAPIMDTSPVLVIDTTPEDKAEKVNDPELLDVIVGIRLKDGSP